MHLEWNSTDISLTVVVFSSQLLNLKVKYLKKIYKNKKVFSLKI